MADLPVLVPRHQPSRRPQCRRARWHLATRHRYRAPPGVSLTFGPMAFLPGVRVVLDVALLCLWPSRSGTTRRSRDLDATAVPLGYV